MLVQSVPLVLKLQTSTLLHQTTFCWKQLVQQFHHTSALKKTIESVTFELNRTQTKFGIVGSRRLFQTSTVARSGSRRQPRSKNRRSRLVSQTYRTKRTLSTWSRSEVKLRYRCHRPFSLN